MFHFNLQALPLVTVFVGKPSDGGMCRVLTLSEDADQPNLAEFAVPSPDSPLEPGSPRWANYVKGVVNFFKGNMSLKKQIS